MYAIYTIDHIHHLYNEYKRCIFVYNNIKEYTYDLVLLMLTS